MKEQKSKRSRPDSYAISGKHRSQLRLGKFSIEKKSCQLYTEWVDDEGHFGSRSLIKPLDQNLIYDGNDGLRDLGQFKLEVDRVSWVAIF